MKKGEQKVTDYIPSKAAFRLLEVLLDPASRMKTVTERCKMCNIARKTYYEILKKPEFVNLYRSLALDILKHDSGALINTLRREALRGSAPHLKMALEMANLYAEKVDHNITTETYEERRKRLGLDDPEVQKQLYGKTG